MDKTANLKLNKPKMTDFVSETVEKVFGENCDIIDDVISDITTDLEGKADSSHTHSDLAPKASPAFTGKPTAPTASKGTSTTQLATTKFVQDAIDGIVIPEDTSALAHSHPNKTVLDGITSDKITSWDGKADGSHTHSDLAPIASPAFTGKPTAPTASKGTSTTQLATTKFVQDAIDGIVIPEDTSALAHSHTNKSVLDGISADDVSGWRGHLTNTSNPHGVKLAQIMTSLASDTDLDDVFTEGLYNVMDNTANAPITSGGVMLCVHPHLGGNTYQNIQIYFPSLSDNRIYRRSHYASGWTAWAAVGTVSPTFTGTPTAPTAVSGTNTQQIATTAFVRQEISEYVPYITLSTASKITLSDYTTPAVYWIDHNAGLSNANNERYFNDFPSDVISDMNSRGLSNGNGVHLVVEKAVHSTAQYYRQRLELYFTGSGGHYILTYTRLVNSSFAGEWELMNDPVSVTAAAGTSDNSVATTAFVSAAIAAITASSIGAAAASHNHAASGITSGTLPVTRGGTGLSSLIGTDYSASRVRGIGLQTTVPSSVSNGCMVGVYT